MSSRRWIVQSVMVAMVMGAFGFGVAAGDGRNGADASTDPGVFIDEDAGADAGEATVTPGAFGKFDLHVKDLEISKVLQLLSYQSKRNIVASRNVSGRVTANLYDVNFHQALDAVLHPNGLDYREKGELVYVYTEDELAKIEDQDRKTVSRVVRLNYMRASDAAGFVQSRLSSAGSISASPEAPAGIQPSLGDVGGESHALGNVLVINDYPENVDQIINLLEQLDVRPKQVMIEATILGVQLTEDNRMGVDFSVLADFSTLDIANPLNPVGGLLNSVVDGGTGIQTDTRFGAGDGSFKLGVVEDNIAVVVEALARFTDTTVLARPKLLVLNRQRADLLVGERKGFVTTSQTEVSTVSTVEFLETGTQLSVRPFVSDNGNIRLELRPTISDGTVDVVEGQLVPNEETQTLTTNVMVQNGQTVILGGLFRERTDNRNRQVPFLGDIPLLGAAFRGQHDTIEKTEYIFMIRAHIVDDGKMADAADEMLDRAEMIRIGARKGLLPWARERMTSYHLQRALTHYEEGRADRALASTSWALSLDPRFIPARELREKITGQRDFYVDHDGLSRAVEMFIEEQAAPKLQDQQVQDSQRPSADEDTATVTKTHEAGEEPEHAAAEAEADAEAETGAEARAETDADADQAAESTEAAADADATDIDVDADATADAPAAADSEADASTADAEADATEAQTQADKDAAEADKQAAAEADEQAAADADRQAAVDEDAADVDFEEDAAAEHESGLEWPMVHEFDEYDDLD